MNPLPSRLPRSNAPQPGQSLAGYVLNLAYRLDIPPSALMQRTGLTSKSRVHILRLDYGMQLPTECLEPFAHATGMTDEEAIGLTVESLAPVTAMKRISKVRADRHWIDIRTTRYCPQCLTSPGTDLDQPVWRLDWLTPWAIACVRHACLLLDACPGCDTRVGETEGQLRSLIPHVMVPVTHPAACRAKPANAKHLPLCDTRFDHAEAPAASAEVLRVQRRLDQALNGQGDEPLTSLGVTVTGRQYLLDLRLMMVLLQIANDPDALHNEQQGLALAARRYIASRAETLGALNRQGRTITLPPDDFHARTGLLLAAETLLSSPSSEDQIRHLAATALANETNTWRAAQAGGEPSNALWAALTSNRLHTTAPAKLHLHTGGNQFTLRPEHIPAYLPLDLYEKHFADIAPEYRRRIRRHVPIAIARLVGNFPTAHDAGIYLGYSNHAIQQATGRVAQVFPEQGFNELRKRVAAAAQDLEEMPRVDYRQPRRAITADWTIPDSDWVAVRRRLRQARLVRSDVNWDKRRVLYSVWVWTLLTGGDMNVAPMSLPETHATKAKHGTVKQVRDLQRKACPRHHAIITELAEGLRSNFGEPAAAPEPVSLLARIPC